MRRERLPEGPDDRLVVAGLGVAALGPLVVASLLVIVRDHMARSNAALVFVIVVVLAAALGGRWAGFTAAVVSAMSYDFFLTRPYGSLKIDDAEDIVATVLLLAVGADRGRGRGVGASGPPAEEARARRDHPPAPCRGAGRCPAPARKTCWSPCGPS